MTTAAVLTFFTIHHLDTEGYMWRRLITSKFTLTNVLSQKAMSYLKTTSSCYNPLLTMYGASKETCFKDYVEPMMCEWAIYMDRYFVELKNVDLKYKYVDKSLGLKSVDTYVSRVTSV